MDYKTFLLDIIFISVLILVNAFFVAIEFAIVRLRNTELEPYLKKGDRRAKSVKHLKDHVDKYIAAAQLGITLVNILLGYIGEDLFIKFFKPFFSLFIFNQALNDTVSVIFGILLITFFAVAIGEVAPKTVSIRYPLAVSLWSALPIRIFYKVFQPFIWALNVVANFSTRLFGIEPVTKDEIKHSEEEIRYIISEGRKTGVIDSTEHQLIEKIFDFNDKVAKDIMVPRERMFAIDITEKREIIIQKVIDEGYSRIPVYKEDMDNIIGVFYSKDIISAAEYKTAIIIEDIIRPAYFIPESRHIGELLKDLQKQRIHLGIVVNEHGGVEGLITLEDIIEEIVGEIEDEYDVETRNVIRDKKGIFLVDPAISIEDFNKQFNSQIPGPTDDYHTLSGFLQDVTGHIPEIFERIDFKGLIFTVMKKSGNKLLQVKVQRLTN